MAWYCTAWDSNFGAAGPVCVMWRFYWKSWSRYISTVRNLNCTNDTNPFLMRISQHKHTNDLVLNFSNYSSCINCIVSMELDNINLWTINLIHKKSKISEYI